MMNLEDAVILLKWWTRSHTQVKIKFKKKGQEKKTLSLMKGHLQHCVTMQQLHGSSLEKYAH